MDTFLAALIILAIGIAAMCIGIIVKGRFPETEVSRNAQDYLNAITLCFLACHLLISYHFNVLPVYISLGNSLLQCSVQTYFVNHTKASSADLQLNPATLLYIVELLAEEVNIKASLCVVL